MIRHVPARCVNFSSKLFSRKDTGKIEWINARHGFENPWKIFITSLKRRSSIFQLREKWPLRAILRAKVPSVHSSNTREVTQFPLSLIL